LTYKNLPKKVQLREFLRIKQKDTPRSLAGKRLTNRFFYVNGKLIPLAVHRHINGLTG